MDGHRPQGYGSIHRRFIAGDYVGAVSSDGAECRPCLRSLKEGGVFMRRALLLLVTMALALLLASGVAYSQTTPTANLDANTLPSNRCSPSNLASAKDRPAITVMSRNLYLGADLSPIFAAASRGDGPGIIQATTNAWATINATNFPERAETLADEIEHSEPLLVGLQEVSLFRTGPFDSFSGNPTPAEHVELDYLNILMRELERRDLNYTPVAITKGADGETPGFYTNLPVILVGDFNSRADGSGTKTYSNLIEAGFTDAWSATRPGELGNTWGHDENLLNTTVDLTQRIDLVLFRDNLCALDANVVGDELTDRTPSGLWPSDHAGVVATLRGE
jgi:Endonuclease/Exonuclease/phosphatase family